MQTWVSAETVPEIEISKQKRFHARLWHETSFLLRKSYTSEESNFTCRELGEELRFFAVAGDINSLLGACHRNIKQTFFRSDGLGLGNCISFIDCRCQRDNPIVCSCNEDVLKFQTFNAMHCGYTQSIKTTVIDFVSLDSIGATAGLGEQCDVVINQRLCSSNNTDIP